MSDFDPVFFRFLASRGVSADDYTGYDGNTKLGWNKVFQQQQQQQLQSPGYF
jgi:hypothetical protein